MQQVILQKATFLKKLLCGVGQRQSKHTHTLTLSLFAIVFIYNCLYFFFVFVFFFIESYLYLVNYAVRTKKQTPIQANLIIVLLTNGKNTGAQYGKGKYYNVQ